MLTKIVVSLALVSLTLAEMKRHQNITVIGQITCSGKPVSGALIELKEKDFREFQLILLPRLHQSSR